MNYFKKTLSFGLLALFFFAAAPFAQAEVRYDANSSSAANIPRCTQNSECRAPSGNGTRTCSDFRFNDDVVLKLCTGCNTEGAAACSSGTACNETSGACEAPGGAGQTTGTAVTPTTGTPTTPAGNSSPFAVFVPLTSIPGISQVGNTDTLPNFLNSLYRLCVGLAAALAVLQITRAGIVYMLQDTGITEKKQARQIMEMSVFGLILVLSPAIVFGVIDPRILDLKIDAEALHTADAPAFSTTGSGDGGNAAMHSAIISAAGACGVTLTEEGRTCINAMPGSLGFGNFSQDALIGCFGGVGGANGIPSDKLECVVGQLGQADPGTVGAQGSGGESHPGTYISWGRFSSESYVGSPTYKPADDFANAWLASSVCANKSTKQALSCRHQDDATHCGSRYAYCANTLPTEEVRIKRPGGGWENWKLIANSDQSKVQTFVNECKEALGELSNIRDGQFTAFDHIWDGSFFTTATGRHVIRSLGTHTCDRVMLSHTLASGDYASNYEFECRRATYSCNIVNP